MTTRRRFVAITLMVAGVLLVAGVIWVSWNVYQAYKHLSRSAELVAELERAASDITQVDTAQAEALLVELQVEAAAAETAANDPIVGLATVVPFIGDDLQAIRSVSSIVSNVADDGLPPLFTIASAASPDNLQMVDGRIPLQQLGDGLSDLQAAADAFGAARIDIDGIDRGGLISPVDRAVGRLEGAVTRATELTTQAARTAELTFTLMGGNGPRSYLLVLQNLAEPRATGGIFGSFVRIDVNNGLVSLAGQGSSSRDLGEFDPPIAGLSAEQRELYTDRPERFPVDVNFTPDFPTAANLFEEMYRKRGGAAVDGVVALDPVAISYLLGDMQIDLGGGIVVSRSNVARLFMSDIYNNFPEAEDAAARDAFLKQATRAVFSDVIASGSSGGDVIQAVRRAIDERRLLIWSTWASEQTDLSAAAVGGALDKPGNKSDIGVFVNDGTGAKLGFYLRGGVTADPKTCTAGGQTVQVRVGLDYEPPTSGLPAYVLGLQASGEPYVLRSNVLVVAPPGGAVTGVRINGQAPPVQSGSDQGRPVSMVTVDLKPGESTEITADVTMPSNDPVSLTVMPGVDNWSTEVGPSC